MHLSSSMPTTKTKAMTAARLKYVRIIVGRNEVWEVDRVGPEERASYWWTKPELKQIRNDYKEEVMMDGVRSLVKTRIEQEHDDRCHDTDFIDDTVDEIMNRPPHLIAAYLEAPPPPPKSKTGDNSTGPMAKKKKNRQHGDDDDVSSSSSSSSSNSDEDSDSQDSDREDNEEENDSDNDDDAFHRKKRDETDDFVSDDDIYSMFGLGDDDEKEEALPSKEAKEKVNKSSRKKDIVTRKELKRSDSKTVRRSSQKKKATATTAKTKSLSSKDGPPSPSQSEVSRAGAANPQSPDSGSENETPTNADSRSSPTTTNDETTKLSAETVATQKSKFKQAVWTVLATERLVRLGTTQAPRRTTSALIEKYLPSDDEDEDFLCEPGLTGQTVAEQTERKEHAKEEELSDEKDGRADCPICLGLVEPSQQRKITLLRRMLCRKCFRTHYTSRKGEDESGESGNKEGGAIINTENSSESHETNKVAQKALSPSKEKSARLDSSRKIHTRSVSPKKEGGAKSKPHVTSPSRNEESSNVDEIQDEPLNESVVPADEAMRKSPIRSRQVEDPYIPLLFQVDAALEEMEDMSVLLAAESYEKEPDFKPMHLDDVGGHIDLTQELLSPSTNSTSKRSRKSKSLRSLGISSKISTKRSEKRTSKRSGTLSDDAASTASKDRKRRSSRSLGSNNSNSSNRSLGSSIGSLDSHSKGKSTSSDKKKSSNSSSITRRGRRSSSGKPLASRSTKKPSSSRSINSRDSGGEGPKTDDALESTFQTTRKERVKRRTASRRGDTSRTKIQHDSKDTEEGRRKKEELKERLAKRREKKRAAERAQTANGNDAEETAAKTVSGSSTTGLAQRSPSKNEQAGLLASFLRGEEGIADYCGDEDENTIQSAPL